jgi:hypothetical protein
VSLRHELRSPASAALALVLLESALRLVIGGPYVGATALLLLACGLALVPFVPAVDGLALRLAVLPAVAIGSFSILLTSIGTLGITLTETTIRLGVAALVLAGAVLQVRLLEPVEAPARSRGRELLAAGAVVILAAFSFASSWDVVGPFPPRGTDWGHYFLFADEVERQGGLLLDDPLDGQPDEHFADPPMVGALYGGTLILDGISSRSLGPGVAIASAVSVLAIVAAAGGLWGLAAGLVAGGLYSVAPIRLDPMYWHGLATNLALVFVPLVLLALGLVFRGRRDPATVALLGLALTAIAAAHSTTAVAVALSLVAALVLDAIRAAAARRGAGGFLRRWWERGAVAPMLAGIAVAAVLGSGVVVHVLRQARSLGEPVDYSFFDPDWLTWNTVEEYLSAEFLLLGAASLLALLAWRPSRRDPALLAVAALLLGSIAASQLWRFEIPFEYRRAVYPFGVAVVLLIGAAAARLATRWAIAAPLALVVCVYFAHESIGLRLPERLLSEREPTSSAPAALDEVRSRIDGRELPETHLVVADQCLHFIVPYLLRRPTIAAFEAWQVAFRDRLPAARRASVIVRGGPVGRRLADELDAGYVVVDPRCTPDPAPGLGGEIVVQKPDVLVIRLRES